jgi:hypothetical protein
VVLSVFVDFLPVPNSQDGGLLAFQIKDHIVPSDPEQIGPQFQLLKRFGVGERTHSLLIVDL